MEEWRIESLPWRIKPPADFRSACREALRVASDDGGLALRALAGCCLDLNQLTFLARQWEEWRLPEGSAVPGFEPFRLGVVGNATLGLLLPCLVASGLRYGLDLHLVAGDFGALVAEAVDPGSRINRFQADAVWVALDHRGLPFLAPERRVADALVNAAGGEAFREGVGPGAGRRPGLPGENLGSGGDDQDPVAAALGLIATLRQGFRASLRGPLVLQTLPLPPLSLFGHYDRRSRFSLRGQVEAFNQALVDSLEGSPDLLFDAAGLAATVGLERWHDPVQWHAAKLAFAPTLTPWVADHLVRLLATLRGKSRKCLVLDLDNTLWGGIIGDDGLNGLVLGQGSPLGEAFLEVQRQALALNRRGIVLAVCSKNEEGTAMLPFLHHPEMVVRRDHLAVFVANWQDKASNLERIAASLNLGLDSLVLLDDNPAERAQVRQTLPMVEVPELPEDPALYPQVLAAGGYFEAVNFTEDDRHRAQWYRERSRREPPQEGFRDLDAFLASLEMVVRFSPFAAVGRGRIAQLINKTNQFNLTTRRYSEAEVAAMEIDPELFTLQIRLADRFGDNGMIGVVICRRRESLWEIDTWLMSCRVLNRKVELATLRELLDQAAKAGISALLGRFIPTERNGMVRDHYARLGFTPVGKEGETTLWRLAVTPPSPLDLPMRIHSEARGAQR
ncbi:MAG: HAD family hydrolase [Magnetococcales bacterium]|nr:HAD family hydrolase [Magnetococcales bacterium]